MKSKLSDDIEYLKLFAAFNTEATAQVYIFYKLKKKKKNLNLCRMILSESFFDVSVLR